MRVKFLLLLLYVFLAGCASWKNSLVSQGGSNEAIQNAIADFKHDGKLYREDNVFSINVRNVNNDVLAVSIFGDPNKTSVITEDERNYSYRAFPTNYYKSGNKLFYWRDSTRQVDNDLIRVFTEAHLVDTAIVNKYIPNGSIDDAKKATDYFFCKTNLKRYKKVRTSIGFGYYKFPDVKCQ